MELPDLVHRLRLVLVNVWLSPSAPAPANDLLGELLSLDLVGGLLPLLRPLGSLRNFGDGRYATFLWLLLVRYGGGLLTRERIAAVRCNHHGSLEHFRVGLEGGGVSFQS